MIPHTTIFTVMSALAQKHGAINLAQGFPGFVCSGELVDLVYKYMKAGYNQYAPMAGVLPLREQLLTKVQHLYKVALDPEKNICITAGATEAVHVAIRTCLQKNDEIIVFEPAFDVYPAAIEAAHAKAVYVPLSSDDFSIDWELVKNAITSKTKAILINSPHNPTGAVLTKSDLDNLEQIVLAHNLFVISDEVYEHIVFDGQVHESVLKSETLRDRSFVIGSLGKTFHVTGWRLGYCIGSEYLLSRFKHLHQYITFAANTPMQYACADFLKNSHTYEHLSTFFQNKRDLFLSAMEGSYFKPIHSSGTYFQLMDYSAISTENDVDLAKYITESYKVASIPISVFYHSQNTQNALRFCFAKEDDELLKAAEILRKIDAIHL